MMLFAAIDPDVNANIYEGFKEDLNREIESLDNRKFERARNERKINMIKVKVTFFFCRINSLNSFSFILLL